MQYSFDTLDELISGVRDYPYSDQYDQTWNYDEQKSTFIVELLSFPKSTYFTLLAPTSSDVQKWKEIILSKRSFYERTR